MYHFLHIFCHFQEMEMMRQQQKEAMELMQKMREEDAKREEERRWDAKFFCSCCDFAKELSDYGIFYIEKYHDDLP